MPTLSLKDYNRLKAFMARTTSEHDNEALTSIRMANKVLTDNKLSWQDVFARTVKIVDAFEADPEREAPAPAAYRDRHNGGTTFEEREAQVNDDLLLQEAEQAALHQSLNAKQFVESCRSQFDQRGTLTPKQRAALRDVRDR